MISIFPIGIFIALIILQVESWPARLVMSAIVFGLWALVSSLAAGISAALFSVGILIATKIPRQNKW